MRSRTWLLTLFHKNKCLYAENLIGSRIYLSVLFDVCSILVDNSENLDEYELSVTRCDLADKKHGGDCFNKIFTRDEIRHIASAAKKTEE